MGSGKGRFVSKEFRLRKMRQGFHGSKKHGMRWRAKMERKYYKAGRSPASIRSKW